jgi:hypothetical protein
MNKINQLILEDYKCALITLIWDWQKASKTKVFIFGIVELIPNEVPEPNPEYYPMPLSSSAKHQLVYQSALLPISDTISWWEYCRQGSIKLDDLSKIKKEIRTGIINISNGFNEDPKYPNMVVSFEDNKAVPFIPKNIQCPRMRHLLQENTDDFKDWTEGEKERAYVWLSEQLGFNLFSRKYKRLIGSLHMIAPNPMFREVDEKLSKNDSGETENINLWFNLRSGVNIEDLEIVIRDVRSSGIGTTYRQNFKSRVNCFNMQDVIVKSSYDIYSKKHGLIHTSSPKPFIRSLVIRSNILSGSRKVIMRDGREYKVPITSGESLTQRNESSLKPGCVIMQHLVSDLKASQVEENWFDCVSEAEEFLREKIKLANKTARFIDPYFGADDLFKFALAIGNYSCKIEILSSVYFARKKVEEGKEVRQGQLMYDNLHNINQKEKTNPFKVRLMTGKKPDIHDRFLIIDNSVWLLGSSYNEFGSRGTMAIKLKNPEPIIGKIEEVWIRSKGLNEWVNELTVS